MPETQTASIVDTLTHGGLRFNPPKSVDSNGNTKSIYSLQCFGQKLDNAHILDAETLAQVMTTLPTVKKVPLKYDFDGKMLTKNGAFGVMDTKTGASYGRPVTERYEVTQDINVVKPFYDVVMDYEFKPIGNIWTKDGRLTGDMFLADDMFVIDLMHLYDSPVIIGFEFSNAHAGDRSVRGRTIGVRGVCRNFNFWGEEMGSFVYPHLAEDTAYKEYESMIHTAIKQAPNLAKKMETASYDVIDLKHTEDIEFMLWNVFPKDEGLVKLLQKNLKDFAPEIDKFGLNRLLMHNSVTGFLSYTTMLNEKDIRKHLELANILLDNDYDSLVENGMDLKADFLDKLANNNKYVEKEAKKKLVGRIVA